jgi:hypothetical protein
MRNIFIIFQNSNTFYTLKKKKKKKKKQQQQQKQVPRKHSYTIPMENVKKGHVVAPHLPKIKKKKKKRKRKKEC